MTQAEQCGISEYEVGDEVLYITYSSNGFWKKRHYVKRFVVEVRWRVELRGLSHYMYKISKIRDDCRLTISVVGSDLTTREKMVAEKLME